jgi:hypothetical protein
MELAALALLGQLLSFASCDVTLHPSNGLGDQRLRVFAPSQDGEFVFKPGGAGFVTSDGALGIKFGWQRGISGQLTIEGRRIDAEAPPLRSEVNAGYGDIGWQASYVIFPTPGCWQVTGRVESASLSFVIRVAKVGDGPSWRRGDR